MLKRFNVDIYVGSTSDESMEFVDVYEALDALDALWYNLRAQNKLLNMIIAFLAQLSLFMKIYFASRICGIFLILFVGDCRGF